MRQFLGGFENKMRHLLSSSPPCISVSDSIQLMGSVHFLDGSWFLQGRNGREEFERGPRILGAQFLDIDDIASKDFESNPKQLPHMMPSPQLFASCMDEMGILPDDDIIVYGTKGCVSETYLNFFLTLLYLCF
jgi:thiosulfate/3-mercaptopyruvate sulfurtransferase